MDKVIQIANICKDMCNVPNPIPGRIYYAKGCAPALNTCGGGVEKTDVFMDKAKVTTPPQFIAVATLRDRKPGYNNRVCQTIRSNAHGAIPHFIWIEPKR